MIFGLFGKKRDPEPTPAPDRNSGPRLVEVRQPRRPGSRFIDAAKTDHLNAGWPSVNHSGDAVIRESLDRVRARSRYLSYNDPYFNRFLTLAVENVIGAHGVRLQMRVIERFEADGTVVFDDRANRLIEEAWKKWSRRKFASNNRVDSFNSIERLVLRTVAADGEVFVRKVRGNGNKFGFALQLIEADHVDIAYNKELPNDGYIRMGIEYDSDDRVVGYHVFQRHPGDGLIGVRRGQQQRVFIPARNMVHIFLKERITQSRGVPWGLPSMARSKMLDGYEQAELVAARVGASKMGFMISPDGESYVGDGEGVDENGNEITLTDADPGTFEQLPEGWDVKTFDPDHPSTAFDAFTKRILRGISAGLGVGYNTLANDYEGVNYSSLRQSNLTERDCWRLLQGWVIESLHSEIFEDWLTMAITSGQVNLPILKLEKFLSPTWRPRGWQWVDPLKEVNAHKVSIALGLDSATNIIAQQGRDIEEVYQDQKNEITLRDKYGIVLDEASASSNFKGEDDNASED